MFKTRSDRLTIKSSFQKAGFCGKTAIIISSWFGSGLIPKAPGTFGTLAAFPLVIIVNELGRIATGAALLIIIPLAVWSADRCRLLLMRDDPPEVVIDEVAGFLVALSFIQFSWLNASIGFFLFRAFDIFKPFPIGYIDRRVKEGWGIVLDDIIAGIYTNICVRCVTIISSQ